MATGLRLGVTSISAKTKISDFDKVRQMAVSNGYILSQNNGQRIFGPPITKDQITRPNKTCEIFIGNIPRNIFENKLIPMIMTCGKFYEFRLMLDFQGNNRGFAFVLFQKKKYAECAIRLFNDYELVKGRCLAVVHSVDNDRLYLGGIKDLTGEEVVRKIYSQVTNLKEICLAVKLTQQCTHVYIHFDTHTNAAMARRCLIEKSFNIWGYKTLVDWAHRHESDIKVPVIVRPADIEKMNDLDSGLFPE